MSGGVYFAMLILSRLMNHWPYRPRLLPSTRGRVTVVKNISRTILEKSILKTKYWPYRLTVRTSPSQGGNRGSIPRGVKTSLRVFEHKSRNCLRDVGESNTRFLSVKIASKLADFEEH